MTEKEYRSHPAISRSELWKIHESPEKFRWYKDHPQEPTPSLLFGQVVHKLILEPDTFCDEFAVCPEVNRRTKAGKEAYEEFVGANDGKTIVSSMDYGKALEMAAKIQSNPICAELLNGQHEVPYFWTDEETGIDCKCRVDCIKQDEDGRFVIVDYKTTADASTDKFNSSIWRYGYAFQSAMYSDGVMTALNLPERPRFVFIAQEKAEPYAVNVVEVTDDVMLAGIDTFRELIGIYRDCSETGYWYGYNGVFDEVNESYLPGWMQMGEEQDDDE